MTLFEKGQRSIPFRLSGWAWLLWETQTHAHTQRRQAQSDASRHTQTHVSTHTYSPSLSSPSYLLSGLFPLSQHPPSTKEPQTRSMQASMNTRKASFGSFFVGLQSPGPEVGSRERSTTVATEHQPSPSDCFSLLSAQGQAELPRLSKWWQRQSTELVRCKHTLSRRP